MKRECKCTDEINPCVVCRQRARARDYKRRNKEHIAEYNKNYKAEHKDDISKYNKNYNIVNRATIQPRVTRTHKLRRQTDPTFKYAHYLRSRINKVVKGEQRQHLVKTLGCSLDNFRKWLEYLFTDDMEFTNHGPYWHIDHIIPCAAFSPENIAICFHWSNHQPLLAEENLKKGDRIQNATINVIMIKP
jgi:hypothetical protein